MSRLSAALALTALTGLATELPGVIARRRQPPRPKEPGTGECKCGRRISYWAGQCAACAGVTDSPTARRMARAAAREAHKLKIRQAIAEICKADPADVERLIEFTKKGKR